jgi:hypothetical protein
VDRAVWWNPGAYAAGVPGDNSGPANYTPRAGLRSRTTPAPVIPTATAWPASTTTGSVLRDTTWRDLAGRTVTCIVSTSPIDVGAVQYRDDRAPDNTPPGTVQGLRRTDTQF